MKTYLWFSDSHDCPHHDKSRFELLGRLIVDRRPDVIVQGGDFASMESLSHWDQNKRLLIEGRRVKNDLYSARVAWHMVATYIWELQEKQVKAKTKKYRPGLVWFEGNHEDWVRQWMERTPEMDGMIDLKDQLELDSFTDFAFVDYVPWKEVRVYDGILFCHAPIGRTGPIYSKYISARALTDVTNIPIIFGHTHRKQEDTIARFDGEGRIKVIRAINGGCFFETWPHYAEGNTNDYWQGVLLIHVYEDGLFDVEEWSLERLRRKYENH